MTCNSVKKVCDGKPDSVTIIYVIKLIIEILHQIEFCTPEFFDRDYPPSETPSCYAELLPLETRIVYSTTTTTPSPSSNTQSTDSTQDATIDGDLVSPIPKTLCSGDLSFKTVYGQRCKVNTFHFYFESNKLIAHCTHVAILTQFLY